VAALVGVGGGAAPVLLQEEAQPLGGGRQVGLGVQRAQQRVEGDAPVEGGDEPLEERVAADRLEDGDGLVAGGAQGVSPAFCIADASEAAYSWQVRVAPEMMSSFELCSCTACLLR
jgi:hypothetical protein